MRALHAVSARALLALALSLATSPLAGCADEPPPPPAVPVAAAPPPPPAPPPIATTPDEAFRATKPEPLATEPAFTPPVPVQRKLKNGAPVLVVENHALPLVVVEVAVQAGADRDPAGRRGLAGFVSDMLLEGTKTRSALEVAVARERLAARLYTSDGLETMTIHLNALKETLPEALTLLADVVENPAFKPEDVERVRGLLLTGLAAKKGNPRALARDAFAKALFGDKDPWGLPSGGTPETLKSITVKDLARFHQAYFVPNDAVISVSGDVTPDEAVAALEKAFSGWKKGTVPPRVKATPPALSPRTVLFSDLPTGTQSQVLVGWRAPRANDPDMLPFLVANNIIGGLFTSRLNLNLREQKAFSYGVFSQIQAYRDVSIFGAAGGIVAAHTAEAVGEFEKELAHLRTEPITDEEIHRAKEAILRGLPSQLETNDAVASAMAALVEEGRPLDYYATLPARVRAVQKADVVAVVQKLFDPDRWPVVVVGPRATVLEPLKALGVGPVRDVTP